jgi:hypothetical protein
MAAIFRVEIREKQAESSLFISTAARSLIKRLLSLFYTVFSNTINICSSLRTIDEVPQPYRRTGITVTIPYSSGWVTGRYILNRIVESNPEK